MGKQNYLPRHTIASLPAVPPHQHPSLLRAPLAPLRLALGRKSAEMILRIYTGGDFHVRMYTGTAVYCQYPHGCDAHMQERCQGSGTEVYGSSIESFI